MLYSSTPYDSKKAVERQKQELEGQRFGYAVGDSNWHSPVCQSPRLDMYSVASNPVQSDCDVDEGVLTHKAGTSECGQPKDDGDGKGGDKNQGKIQYPPSANDGTWNADNRRMTVMVKEEIRTRVRF